jgi:hypothetical protein
MCHLKPDPAPVITVISPAMLRSAPNVIKRFTAVIYVRS